MLFLFMYIFFNFFSFLSSLLLLEACSLILFLFFSMYLMIFGVSMKFLLYYFVFIVSESAVGLSILVTTMKTFGSGNFRSMSLTK
uniref:NADH dehydrogenase subunit 4L n=1 Tax=Scirtothrips dorsalis TaxID=163899 RepID=A0A089PHG3_SCIDO|nr:NADH dehydrogenase subunit 4L [Scirtothrips dorsalis]AIQ81005.1 NADH dehydrogenase subunit 4L [Scirtothrips dorsalis]